MMRWLWRVPRSSGSTCTNCATPSTSTAPSPSPWASRPSKPCSPRPRRRTPRSGTCSGPGAGGVVVGCSRPSQAVLGLFSPSSSPPVELPGRGNQAQGPELELGVPGHALLRPPWHRIPAPFGFLQGGERSFFWGPFPSRGPAKPGKRADGFSAAPCTAAQAEAAQVPRKHLVGEAPLGTRAWSLPFWGTGSAAGQWRSSVLGAGPRPDPAPALGGRCSCGSGCCWSCLVCPGV